MQLENFAAASQAAMQRQHGEMNNHNSKQVH